MASKTKLARPGSADRPKGGRKVAVPDAATCKYGGTEYSQGARIEQAGETMECNHQGVWIKVAK